MDLILTRDRFRQALMIIYSLADEPAQEAMDTLVGHDVALRGLALQASQQMREMASQLRRNGAPLPSNTYETIQNLEAAQLGSLE